MKTAAGLKYLFTAVGLRLTITRNRLHKFFLSLEETIRNPMHSDVVLNTSDCSYTLPF